MKSSTLLIGFALICSVTFGQNRFDLAKNSFINQNQNLPVLAGLNGTNELAIQSNSSTDFVTNGLNLIAQYHLEKINSTLYTVSSSSSNSLSNSSFYQNFKFGVSPKFRLKNNVVIISNVGLELDYRDLDPGYFDSGISRKKDGFGFAQGGFGLALKRFFTAAQFEVSLSKSPLFSNYSSNGFGSYTQRSRYSNYRIIVGSSGRFKDYYEYIEYNVNLCLASEISSFPDNFFSANATFKFDYLLLGGSFSNIETYSGGIGYQHHNKWSFIYAHEKNSSQFRNKNIHKIGFRYILKTNEDNAKIQLQSMF